MSENFISRIEAENDLLACAAYIGERVKSGDGRAEAMKSVVPYYIAKGNVDIAAELANSIDDPFSRDKLLTLVAEKCAEINDDDYAMQLAESIEDRGLQGQAFERIALVKAASGDMDRARNIADLMTHHEFVYAGIAVNQMASGDEIAALETIESIEFASARCSALQHIAAAMIEKGELVKAVEMLDLAFESTDEIEHSEEKIRILSDIGNLYSEAKRNDKAIEVFHAACSLAEKLDNTHRDSLLGNCALGFLHAGSSELAERTLDLVTDKTQMASALLGFARDQWKNGAKEEAVDTLEESYAILKSQRETETRDSRLRNALMSSIAAQFAGFGKTERGVEIAGENMDADQQMSALSQIAQILTVQNEDGLARETIDSISDDAARLFALITISDAKHQSGDSEAAAALLDEAASLAETVPQPASRSTVLNEIASRFVEQLNPKKAKAVASQNLAIIAGIRDQSSQSSALASLSAIYDHPEIELGDEEKQIVEILLNKVDY